MLAWNGKIILPNMKCVNTNLMENKQALSKYFTIIFLKKEAINENPLVYATEVVTDLLMFNNPNPFTNENQINRLDKSIPFFCLKYNKHPLVPVL